jgi:hypothetical protein
MLLAFVGAQDSCAPCPQDPQTWAPYPAFSVFFYRRTGVEVRFSIARLSCDESLCNSGF